MDAILRIAGNDYEVRRPTTDPALANESNGEIDFTKLTITIEGSLPDWMQRKTLLHELIHASDKFISGEEENELSETQVAAVENALWSIFRDNPGLAAAIFEGTA